MSYDQARVPLLRLYPRTSSKGTEYLSGFLGLASVVAFKGQDDQGRECWLLQLSTPKPRDGTTAPRKQGQARQEPFRPRRVSAEVLASYEARKAAPAAKPVKAEREPLVDDDLPWGP